MRTTDMIDIRVINSRYRDSYLSATETHPHVEMYSSPNDNRNNNNNNNNNNNHRFHTSTTDAHRREPSSVDDLSDVNSLVDAADARHPQASAMTSSHPNLHRQYDHLQQNANRNYSGSVPSLATGSHTPASLSLTNYDEVNSACLGIPGSPKISHARRMYSIAPERKFIHVSPRVPAFTSLCIDHHASPLPRIIKKDAPVARLCHVRKFPSSPFFGFFLCGDPNKLG